VSELNHRFPHAHLGGQDGRFVEFSVDGYEFPDKQLRSEGFDHDANWLFVIFRVSDGRRTWSSRDAAWLTTDLPRLSAWLRAAADGGHPDDWTALEPLLTLCVEDEPLSVVARLALELRSEDVRMSDIRDEAIELNPTADELLQAADVVDQALDGFPVRD